MCNVGQFQLQFQIFFQRPGILSKEEESELGAMVKDLRSEGVAIDKDCIIAMAIEMLTDTRRLPVEDLPVLTEEWVRGCAFAPFFKM